MTAEQPEATERLRPSLHDIERQRRHLWWAALGALGAASVVVVLLSYRADVFPDTAGDAAGFAGWRFAFLVLAVGFIVYALFRERMLHRLARRLTEESARTGDLEAQVRDLGEADRFRRDIVAAVTHELKTPLTSLLGYTTILRRRAASMTPVEREEFIDVLERQGQRILRLIEELIQSSRMDAGALRLERVPVNVGAIVRTAVDEIGAVRERAIESDVPAEDLGVFGDPTALEHVVLNLIDNACKYSDAATPVRAAVLEVEGEVLITVSDEGIGIDPDELPHIFERYRQGGPARGRSSVGLGLYIVHTLVHAHGGRVWADSEVGKGTTITVALPRRRG